MLNLFNIAAFYRRHRKLTSQKRSRVSLNKTDRSVVQFVLFPGGGVLPYKGLMGTCGQPGYVFRDFCLKQGIEFIIFVLIRVSIYQFLS